MPAPRTVQASSNVSPNKDTVTLTRIFDNFNTDNGLPVNAFTCSLTDRDGNLWLGSNGSGAVRYDGQSFQQFTTANGLSNNGIWQMLQTPEGDIWFATYGGGICIFDGRRFRTMTTKDGLPSNGIYSLCTDSKGRIWAGTVESGACIIEGGRVRGPGNNSGFDAKSVFSITATTDGSVWLSTEKGLFRYHNDHYVNWGAAEGLPENETLRLLSDGDSLWIGTGNSGVYLFYHEKLLRYAPSLFSNGHSVKAMHKTSSGKLWIGTDKGLTALNGGAHDRLGENQGWPKADITSLITDHRGSLWITTEGNGIFRYDGNEFGLVDKLRHLSGNNVYTLCEDRQGRLWLGTTGSGVFVMDKGILRQYTSRDGLASDQLWSMAEDKAGNMWFGSVRNGVTKFDGKTFTTYTTRQGLSNDMVRFICPTRNGDVWFATTGGGVNRLRDGVLERYSLEQGLPSDIVLCAMEDRNGAMWFGTVGRGIFRFDGNTVTTFDTSCGLDNGIVITLLEDNHGNIWFGTEGGGLARYDGKSIAVFSTVNGLADNTVYGLAKDPDGHLWIGTNKGVAKLLFADETSSELASDTNLSNEKLLRLRLSPKVRTGFLFSDITSGQNALLIDRAGTVWVGTGDERYGAVCIRENRNKDRHPGTVHLKSIILNDEPVAWHSLLPAENLPEVHNEEVLVFGHRLEEAKRKERADTYRGVSFESIDRHYPVPRKLSLHYRLNTVNISFGTNEPGLPELTEYRYRLEGFSPDWTEPSHKTSATFGNLPEGEYDFQVCSRFDFGEWGPVTSYSFTVFPPWYRTWYMYCIYVLLMAGTVVEYNRWRTRRLLAANKELEQKVRERTAEVVQEKENVEKEKKKSDDLLLNILPAETAEELKSTGRASPRKYDSVTVLFTDFRNFTQACENMTPAEMVEEIHHCYTAFDRIVSKHGLEKIKTIGDSYMCAGGIPAERDDQAVAAVAAALDIRDFMEDEKSRRLREGRPYFDLRIGLHTGPVVAGIVGEKKFAYDIWGDTVNIASRMESSGETGKINVSEATYRLVCDRFRCIPRGKIEAKNKGSVEMYFVERS
jgi:ligand-binding sensor domain-containing protein/class 3 adenylate cyclase